MQYDRRNFLQIFGERWIEKTEKYINDLTEFKYQEYWLADIRDLKGIDRFKYYYKRARRLILNKFLPDNYKIIDCHNYIPKLITRHPIQNREKFIKYTQEYCQEMFDSKNKENKQFNLIDQLVSPINTEKYLEYVKNLKVIIVDRDPRDVYIECCEKNDHVLPKDIEEFCKVYIDSRKYKTSNSNVMYIYFEDLIYNFEMSKSKIEKFLNLDSKAHQEKGIYYSIEKSKINTRLWKKYPKYDKEVKYIENKLEKYLYKIEENN